MSWGRSQVGTATMAGDGGTSLAGMRDNSSGDGDKIRMERTGGAAGGATIDRVACGVVATIAIVSA